MPFVPPSPPTTNTELFTRVLAILNDPALNDGPALLKALRAGLQLWAQQQLDELNAARGGEARED